MHSESHAAPHGHGGGQPHQTSPDAVAREHPYVGVGIVTISDTASRGEREDLSGQAIKDNLHRFGGTLRHYEIVPDEQQIISQTLIHLVDELHLDLVLTTGGTGLSARDRTPQATLPVLDYEVPGLAEAMRAESAKKAPIGLPVARGSGRAPRVPDREPAGQPQGLRRDRRGFGAAPAARHPDPARRRA